MLFKFFGIKFQLDHLMYQVLDMMCLFLNICLVDYVQINGSSLR